MPTVLATITQTDKVLFKDVKNISIYMLIRFNLKLHNEKGIRT